jgi:hypothetical protein
MRAAKAGLASRNAPRMSAWQVLKKAMKQNLR